MPYIKADDGRREALRNGEPALNAGELNYQMFHYVKYNYSFTVDPYYKFMKNITFFVDRFLGDKPNYQRWNDMTGALIRCGKEVFRRLDLDLMDEFIRVMENYDKRIAEYEDIKIKENGDVE